MQYCAGAAESQRPAPPRALAPGAPPPTTNALEPPPPYGRVDGLTKLDQADSPCSPRATTRKT